MGSKAKITKYIVPIIQRKIDESGARYYVEPFAGGCNVIDKIMALYKQAGNSIPVTIFESIFRKIILGETAEKEASNE